MDDFDIEEDVNVPQLENDYRYSGKFEIIAELDGNSVGFDSLYFYWKTTESFRIEWKQVVQVSLKTVDVDVLIFTLEQGKSLQFEGDQCSFVHSLIKGVLKDSDVDVGKVVKDVAPAEGVKGVCPTVSLTHTITESSQTSAVQLNDTTETTESIEILKQKALLKRDEMIRQAHEWYENEIAKLEVQECTLCYDGMANVKLQCSHRVCQTCLERISYCPWDRLKI